MSEKSLIVSPEDLDRLSKSHLREFQRQADCCKPWNHLLAFSQSTASELPRATLCGKDWSPLVSTWSPQPPPHP